MKTLVVICHPKQESLIRATATRVLAGLERAGHEIRILDLDEMDFDPVLTKAEVRGHLGGPGDRPELSDHFDALRWAEQLVLVYPTWFSGQPARLKGWFDRVWMHRVAFELPEGANRIRGRLGNIGTIHVVTSHGSTRRVNWIQGDGGRLRVFRTLRVLCGVRCRTRWTAVYDVDNRTRRELGVWLDEVEQRFSPRPRPGIRMPRLRGPRGAA